MLPSMESRRWNKNNSIHNCMHCHVSFPFIIVSSYFHSDWQPVCFNKKILKCQHSQSLTAFKIPELVRTNPYIMWGTGGSQSYSRTGPSISSPYQTLVTQPSLWILASRRHWSLHFFFSKQINSLRHHFIKRHQCLTMHYYRHCNLPFCGLWDCRFAPLSE